LGGVSEGAAENGGRIRDLDEEQLAQEEARRARLVLGLGMLAGAALLLWMGRGLGFTSDELFFYNRVVSEGVFESTQYSAFSLEYLIAPHNSHLHLTGRLAYETLLRIAGTAYSGYRIAEVAGVLLCVGLFFELARTRVGPWAALAPSLLLLVYGYAWEVLLWPFNMMTTLSLAAGLGALLCLERESSRRIDIAVCVLLTLSVASMELGLAFAAGVAVWLLVERHLSRLWIVAVPVLLYAAWYLWSQQFDQVFHFDQPGTDTDLIGVLHSIGLSSGAVIGSLLAVNPVPDGPPWTVGAAAWPVLSALFAVAVGLLVIAKRPSTPFLWTVLVVLLAYWLSIGLAGRPPDASRYIFTGSILLLLVAAEALRGVRISPWIVACLFLAVAVALPRNIQLLSDGRELKLEESNVNRVVAGAQELVGPGLRADYVSEFDPLVRARGGAGQAPITAGEHVAGAARVGSYGYSVDEIVDSSDHFRDIADAVLAHAGGLEVLPAKPVARRRGCLRLAPPGKEVATIPLGEGVVMGTNQRDPIPVRARLFGPTPFEIGAVSAESWLQVTSQSAELPSDWQLIAETPLVVCSPPEGG
jgi:hypothetical protein